MAIDVGDAVLTITGDSSDLDRELSKVDGKIKSSTGNWQKNTRIAGAAVTGMGIVTVGAFGFMVKGAMDFETGMREVNTMMGLSEEEFQSFSDEVQALASRMGVDAVASTKALYQAISAGVPKENVLEFLEIASKAAIGGVTDTTVAVDGLTTVINAFGLEWADAEHIADIMFTTVKGGKTTMDEISATMFNVGPMAAAMGIDFETVAAALATMTKQGIPTAQATTMLRQSMVAIAKPTKEMTDVIQSLGYETGQAMLDELGYAETLNILRDATDGNNEMLMKMFGSVEAGQAVLALTGDNAQMFTADLKAMDNAAGASQAAFEEMEESPERMMVKLKEAAKGLGNTIGKVLIPMLKDLLEKIKPIIDKIMEWIQKNPGLTKVIVIGTAALGALMLVLGPLLMILPGIVAALPLLGGALALLTGPVGIAIAAIAALIAIGVLLVKNWDKVKEGMAKVWEGIVAGFKWYMNLYVKGINWLISMLNKISFTIPDWIPGVGGRHFGINIPTLPSFEGFEGIVPGVPGTPIPAIVHAGEVISQGGGETVITGNNFYIREESDITKVARELFILQRTKARQHGV